MYVEMRKKMTRRMKKKKNKNCITVSMQCVEYEKEKTA